MMGAACETLSLASRFPHLVRFSSSVQMFHVKHFHACKAYKATHYRY